MKATEIRAEREEKALRAFLIRDAEPVLEYIRRGRRAEDDQPVMLHVDRVVIQWVNGELEYVRCEGRRLKADGKPGSRDGSVGYSSRMFTPERLAALTPGTYLRPPDWLVDLVRGTSEPSLLEHQRQARL